MAPIACGQYYWVFILAPDNYKKALSYVVGWLTSLAWIATIAIETLLAGTIVQGLLILSYPNYESKQWQGTLLAFAVIACNIFINVVIPGLLPKFEIMIMILHLCGFFAILITLLKTARIGDAASVWLTAFNEGGWPTQGLSYCVGFLGNVSTFVGADASVHMAEEVSDAALTIPRAICASMIVNGLIGFAMMVTTLYCLGDAQSVFDTDTGFPFIQIFYNSVGNVGGAVGMGVTVLILTWACSTGITTAASRMTWSFARDKGMPLSKFLSKVSSRTRIPVVAIFVVTTFAALLVLIYIGSSTAFNDVISLTITGFYGSYFLPCIFLLYHRIKGDIYPYRSNSTNESRPPVSSPDMMDEKIEGRLVWGPWKMPGIFGVINNAYACMYMIFVIFWSVWPPSTPVTVSTMNYSVVVTGGVMILSAVWYWVRARREYHGPIVEEDVATIARRAGSMVAV